MQFSPFEPQGIREGENKLWNALKVALTDEPDGRAYFGYTPRDENGLIIKESDVLIIHPEFGICVIECKGCQIHHIEEIIGDDWLMNGWYKKTISPLKQAEKAMYAVQNEINKFLKKEIGRPLRINYSHLVSLPFVTHQEWLEDEYDELAHLRGSILLKEDLEPEKIKQKLLNCVRIKQSNITQEEWRKIWSFCTKKGKRKHIYNLTSEQETVAKVINSIEYESMMFDTKQNEIDSVYPEGPQRLRGLAGTGKTVLLARRAAKIHFEHPDWNIAFVFFTRSLYNSISLLIYYAYQELLEESNQESKSIDWNRLKVLHSWGSKKGGGFYADLTIKCGKIPKTVNDVKHQLDRIVFPDEGFRIVCNELEESQNDIPTLFDAVIIDEGQDLPPSFYRLAYEALSKPKRLYWAYDEAQGVNSLIVPDSTSIFGRDKATNKPKVNLLGTYKGGGYRSYIMSSCYRTPRRLLMAAHAINMGLFREDGAIQGVTTKENWELLGYKVLEGDFRSEGNPVTITRNRKQSPHEVDRDDFKYKSINDSLLTTKVFDSESDELNWIAEEIADDIKVKGFNPNHIIITSPFSDYEKEYFARLKTNLNQKQIDVHLIDKGDEDTFQKSDCVTISNIYRAKGNEAWKVYVCRFEYGIKPLDWKPGDSELHKRNEAFTALTRSKAWCVVTGQESSIFDELNKAIEQYPEYTFPAFNKKSLNKKSLNRVTDDESIVEDESNEVPMKKSKLLKVIKKKF